MSLYANSARAQASRRNGAKSRGPVTEPGKERASKNALKHGLRAKTLILIEGEEEVEFEALDQALKADLQPDGPLETLLANRLTVAAWRMARADRIESDLLTSGDVDREVSLGTRVVRDRHGAQAIDCLLRYRGTAQSEFWRALAALRTLQAEKQDLQPADSKPMKALPSSALASQLNPADAVEIGKAVTEICVSPSRPNEPEGR